MYNIVLKRTPKNPNKPDRPIPYNSDPPTAEKPADAGKAVGVPTMPESLWRKPQVWLGGALVLLLGYILYQSRAKTG